MICENCGKEHDIKFGSGRFCSMKCARGFSTKSKRQEINIKVSLKLTKNIKINNLKKIKKIIDCINCGKETFNNKFCSTKCHHIYERNVALEKFNNNGLLGKHIIKQILFEKYNYGCQKCGWNNVNPYSKTLPLELHHKDNNHKNNNISNLELLCPNCHSLTDNYKGRNKRNKSTRLFRKKYARII